MRREYMIEFRRKRGLDVQSMANKCEISKTLLELLENSDKDVTHPKIAERIGKAYKLTAKQVEGLMPEHYRKSSPNYNPDLYRRDELDFSDFAAELEQVKQERDGLSIMLTAAQSAVESYKRERDATAEDLKGICNFCAHTKTCTGYWCGDCDEFEECKSPCKNCEVAENWQWRGVRE